MPPRTSRRRRQNQDGTQDPTQGQSESGSSTPRGQNEAGREQFARSAQEIGRPKKAEPSDREKMYEIERLKKLEATVFDGSTDPADAETFIGIFEEKYYPTTYCEAKRDEFLELKQGLLSVAEYERKYTELLQYAEMIVASESDRCRRFKRGLRFEICTPLTAIAKWTNFSQLVETALRVEQSIVKEKSAMELSRGVLTTSGIRGREQRRFTLGVNVLGCQDFKRRSGGKPLRGRVRDQPVQQRLFYKPSDVRVASYVCWEGFRGFLCVVFHVEYSKSKIGSVGIVRADDVCWLHAVLQAKTAGGPGGGMTYPPQRVMFSGEERKGELGDKAKLKSCFTLQEILKVFKAQGMSFAKRQVKELFRLLGVHPSSCEEVYDGCQGSMPPYGYME
uniref:Retrotransposon gag domain-containing protein n=1 Tax=Cucumis melo TaxID=3656 RepID=A0A9I9EGP3_CUCME